MLYIYQNYSFITRALLNTEYFNKNVKKKHKIPPRIFLVLR